MVLVFSQVRGDGSHQSTALPALPVVWGLDASILDKGNGMSPHNHAGHTTTHLLPRKGKNSPTRIRTSSTIISTPSMLPHLVTSICKRKCGRRER